MEPLSGPIVQRVVLLGLMASGKSSVGALLAERLGWTHVDLDQAIERREGRSVAEIFRHSGEPHFRRLEVELTREWLGRSRLVLSPGGGWVTNPAVWDLLPPATLTVWLRVSAQESLRRIRMDQAGRDRPLAQVEDPGAALRRLLAEREPLYRRAQLVLETDRRAVHELAAEIEMIVRGRVAPPSRAET